MWLHFVVLAANSNRAGLSGTTVLSPPRAYLGDFSLRRVGQLLHPGNSSTTVDMDDLWNGASTLEDLLISAYLSKDLHALRTWRHNRINEWIQDERHEAEAALDVS